MAGSVWKQGQGTERERDMLGLRAGAARSSITPELGCHMAGYFHDRRAADIHDDLYAKALVLENGESALAIVVCDLIALLQADVEAAREQATRLTGIPGKSIFISCTHTHFGPATCSVFGTPRDEAYMEQAAERIAASVLAAQLGLRPAEAGVAVTAVPGETFNRRWHMRDGSVRANFQIGYGNPDALYPAGPTDPELVVLAVREREGQPIALLANYSLHYVGGPYDRSVSADYFGCFDRTLQRLAGCELVGILANGCCGDVNNIDISRPQPEMPHPFYQAERVANVVAAAAYGAWQGLRGFDYDSDPALAAAFETVLFRRRRPSSAELAAARALASQPMPEEGSPEFLAWLYASEVLAVDRAPLEQPAPLMALRVGPLGIVGLPGEAFAQYGLTIKQLSPFAHTMTVELANGYLGYLPTDGALVEGSYETELARSARAAQGTEGAMVEGALAALQHLAG